MKYYTLHEDLSACVTAAVTTVTTILGIPFLPWSRNLPFQLFIIVIFATKVARFQSY
jgi:hypothetical protein